MPILNIAPQLVGSTGVSPSIAFIQTSDTEAQILVAGYLNQAVQSGLANFSLPCMACVSTIASAGAQPDVGWYEVQYTTTSGAPVSAIWSLIPSKAPGSVTLPTIANHIATYLDVNGSLGEDAATAINGGNIQAGLSGTAGTVASFPATALKGSLVLKAIANTGNTLSTISNDAMGQATVVNIPDPVNAIAQFLIGATATPFVSGNFPQNSGTAGLMVDSGIAANKLQTSALASPDTISDLIWIDVPLGQAALASSGHVTIQASSGAKQYIVRDIRVNYGASGLSGGGGNRLITVTDGTTIWNNAGLTAALLGTPINTVWGGTGNPLPGTVAMNTASVAGSPIYAVYSGGTTDYTAGSVTISVLVQRTA